jgi:hypothetical protein
MKILYLDWSRTGTLSLMGALMQIGYRPPSHGSRVSERTRGIPVLERSTLVEVWTEEGHTVGQSGV